MGVPTSEVGYTSATTGRETTKSIRDMWWHWIKKTCDPDYVSRTFHKTLLFNPSVTYVYLTLYGTSMNIL
jgi:hypothetical protein